MGGHGRSTLSWELKGNHQVPRSLMFPLVHEHPLPVAGDLLRHHWCPEAAKAAGSFCCARDLRNEEPKPQTASRARGMKEGKNRRQTPLLPPR